MNRKNLKRLILFIQMGKVCLKKDAWQIKLRIFFLFRKAF